MSVQLLLEITIKLVPFEPDGSVCDICEDVIYLEGRRPIFVIAGGKLLGKKVGELDHRFCQSCGNLLESEMKGG